MVMLGITVRRETFFSLFRDGLSWKLSATCLVIKFNNNSNNNNNNNCPGVNCLFWRNIMKAINT